MCLCKAAPEYSLCVISVSLLSMKVICSSVACHGTIVVAFEEIIQFMFWSEGCFSIINPKSLSVKFELVLK